MNYRTPSWADVCKRFLLKYSGTLRHMACTILAAIALSVSMLLERSRQRSFVCVCAYYIRIYNVCHPRIATYLLSRAHSLKLCKLKSLGLPLWIFHAFLEKKNMEIVLLFIIYQASAGFASCLIDYAAKRWFIQGMSMTFFPESTAEFFFDTLYCVANFVKCIHLRQERVYIFERFRKIDGMHLVHRVYSFCYQCLHVECYLRSWKLKFSDVISSVNFLLCSPIIWNSTTLFR